MKNNEMFTRFYAEEDSNFDSFTGKSSTALTVFLGVLTVLIIVGLL